jgi:hypothetical protein
MTAPKKHNMTKLINIFNLILYLFYEDYCTHPNIPFGGQSWTNKKWSFKTSDLFKEDQFK